MTKQIFTLIAVISFLIPLTISCSDSSKNTANTDQENQDVQESDSQKTPPETSSKNKSDKVATIPDFTAKTVEGNSFSNKSVEGNVVVVNFWGTWCGPCIKETPHLQELYEELKGKGLTVFGPAVRDTREKVLEFRQKQNLSYPMALGDKQGLVQLFRKVGTLRGIPTTFIFGRAGKLREQITGYRSKKAFRKKIEPLLEEEVPENSKEEESSRDDHEEEPKTARTENQKQEDHRTTVAFNVGGMVKRGGTI